jgi:hypothetical protein
MRLSPNVSFTVQRLLYRESIFFLSCTLPESGGISRRLCFPTVSSTLAAAIIQYRQEAVAYFKIPFQSSLLHAVFVPHPRPDHPSGPSLFTSWKPIDILQIFESPISDIKEASTCRIQRLFDRAASLSGETLNATAKTIHCVSTEQVDLDQGALRKSDSSRTSCTLVETDSHLVHGEDMPCPLGPDLPTATSGFIFEKPLDNMAPEVTVTVEKCEPYKVSSSFESRILVLIDDRKILQRYHQTMKGLI